MLILQYGSKVPRKVVEALLFYIVADKTEQTVAVFSERDTMTALSEYMTVLLEYFNLMLGQAKAHLQKEPLKPLKTSSVPPCFVNICMTFSQVV